MAGQDHTNSISILVNDKSVTLTEKHTTGLGIKQAAVDQSVAIQIDFNLFRIDGNKQHPVGDNDKVTVHEGERFRAVAGDDNSWR